MSRLYILDSNVYIRAFREAAFGSELHEFHRQNLPRLVLSAIVATELLVGAQQPARERAVQRGLIEPFRTRRRLLTPGWSAWLAVASLDRALRGRPGHGPVLKTRSFLHDMLIAASAREIGATVITENVGDFALIARHMDVAFVEPFPPSRRT